MRIRILLALVALILSVATVTLARQQPGPQQGGRRPSKPEPRAELIELRAALELLELEHEAEKAHLLSRIQSMLEFEAMSPTQQVQAAYADTEFQERDYARERALSKKIEAVNTVEELEKVQTQIHRERVEAQKRDREATTETMRRTAKAYLDRKKADYLRNARTISDKRLELAASEKRYSDAR
jgi:hypothetical protein